MTRSKSINASYAVNSIVSAVENCMVDFPYSTGDNTWQVNRFDYFPSTAPYWDDFWTKFSFPIYDYVFCTKEKYPKTSFGIDKNGSTIVRVAITGFSKEDISLERDDMKLIIKATKNKDKAERFKDVKWLDSEIATREFEFEVIGNEKWNWDKDAISVDIENGILTVIIPLKEEAKPKKEVYQIK